MLIDEGTPYPEKIKYNKYINIIDLTVDLACLLVNISFLSLFSSKDTHYIKYLALFFAVNVSKDNTINKVNL